MSKYGHRFPKGSKASSGSSYRSGINESSGFNLSESNIDSMNRDELREVAKAMNVSSRGSIKQLRGRIKDKLQKEGFNISSRDFKTDRYVKTSTKFGSERKVKLGSDYGFSSSEKKDLLENTDDMNFKDLTILKKQLNVKTKARSKAGLKKAIKDHLNNEQRKSEPKSLDTMSLAELRVLASKYDVKSGGKRKVKLRQDLREQLNEIKLNDTAYLQNTEEGSITTASFPEEKFNVSVIDKDVEPHRSAKVERLGEGIYAIDQETVLGEKENVLVTVSDSSPYPDTSSKAFAATNIETSQIQEKKQELSRKEKRIQSREARAYLEKNDPLWENKSSQGKHEAVKRYVDTGRITDFQREAEFEQDLKKEFDLINENKRSGNMVRIPDLRREMETYGYTKDEFDKELFRMEKDRKIELQTASNPKLIPEDQRKSGIPHKTRGHINYVSWRKTDTFPAIDNSNLEYAKTETKLETEYLEKFLSELSYNELRDIAKENKLGWKRDQYSKRGAIKGGTKGGRPSKQEYINAIIKESESNEIVISNEIKEKHITLPSSDPIVKSHPKSFSKNIQQVDMKNDHLLPAQSFDYPKSWKITKVRKEEQKRKEYQNDNISPFYNTIKEKRSSNEVYDLDDLRSKVEIKDIAIEKPQLLTKEQKKLNYGSFGGQNIQAKTDGQIFRGFYFQDAQKDEVKHFFKADMVKVDPDDTGHYLAMMNELYTGHKAKEVYFGNQLGEIDYLRANRFMGKQILSSLAYQRNKAIKDALEDSLSQVPIREDIEDERGVFSPLAYRNSAGQIQDLSVSEEQLAIANSIYETPVNIKVDLVDTEQELVFKYNNEDLEETIKPILFFDVTGGKVKPLDSDTLLSYSVDRMQLEPDAVQNMLEALYQQGWINYPRADTIKAEDEPLYLLRDINEFRGTEYERKILIIIDSADKAYKENKPYIQEGKWILQQGNTQLKKSGVKLIDETDYYSHEGFDISLERGLTPGQLTNFLIDNDITTPATRTAILSAMKEAGIVSLDKNRKYQLDRRGIYFASAFEFFDENEIETSIELKKKISHTQSLENVAEIVNSFDIVNRNQMKDFIRIKAEIMLDQQNDLTILEGY